MKLTNEAMSELRKEGYLVKRGDTEFIRYKGLLSLAHDAGLDGLSLETIQLPTIDNGNRAIFMATAKGSKGSFQDIGDASPKDVTELIVPHLIRMAATRAKARALNNYLGIGICSIEELGESKGRTPEEQKQAYRDSQEPYRKDGLE